MGSYVHTLVERSRRAQEILATYDQAKTDEIVKMFAKVVFDHAEPLAKLADGKANGHHCGSNALYESGGHAHVQCHVRHQVPKYHYHRSSSQGQEMRSCSSRSVL